MIKFKYSFHNQVESAKIQINQQQIKEAIKTHSNKVNYLINMIDIKRIKKFGCILGAKKVTKGMRVFFIDPNNPHHKEFFNAKF